MAIRVRDSLGQRLSCHRSFFSLYVSFLYLWVRQVASGFRTSKRSMSASWHDAIIDLLKCMGKVLRFVSHSHPQIYTPENFSVFSGNKQTKLYQVCEYISRSTVRGPLCPKEVHEAIIPVIPSPRRFHSENIAMHGVYVRWRECYMPLVHFRSGL